MNQQTIGQYLKQRYGRKIYKLSLDGGFSCPNRQSRQVGGCLFCSARGAGDFTERAALSLEEQVNRQMARLANKWPQVMTARQSRSLLLHFQNYSATYAPLHVLSARYQQASQISGVLGLVISTRPDWVGEAHIRLFKRFDIQWVELGLQTANNRVLDAMGVGYSVEDFTAAAQRLQQAGIPVVGHLIVGLPGSTDDDFFRSIELFNQLKLFGIKIHMLNISTDCALAKRQSAAAWHSELPTAEHYINLVKKALDVLRDECVIHRLTGDGDHSKLIAPLWVKDKRKILNALYND